jgi:hypothetical protein
MKLLNSFVSAFLKRIKLRSLALSNASGDCQGAKRGGKAKKKKSMKRLLSILMI